ncbi:MAG: hypothetical protein ACKN9F_07770 [Methylomonas sp.]
MTAITFDKLKFANRLKQAGVPLAHAEAAFGVKNQFIQLEQRITIKLGSLMVVAVGIVATLVKLL